MSEPHDTRLKRLRMRSWRRGIKEMDLILGPFWDSHGAALDAETLEDYESLLSENDQELYKWMSGQATPPAALAPLVQRIRASTENA